MTTRVLSLTRYDRLGASSRVRFYQYGPYLAGHGFAVDYAPLLPRTYLNRLYTTGSRSPLAVLSGAMSRLVRLLGDHDSDLIWLQREVLPFLPLTVERHLLDACTWIADYDDAHHLYYADHRITPVRALYGGKVDGLMRHAHAVVTGNTTLARHAENAGARRVEIVPSAVDVSRFDGARTMPGRFTVGWIGTPVTARQTLPLIEDCLRTFLAETNAHCILCGTGDDVLAGLPVERRAWSEAAESAFFADITVALCPLPDTQFARGKSGYKIIQAMAAGKPNIVSPVGTAGEFVEERATGFQCSTDDAWRQALMTLHDDPTLCAAMGRAAYDQALEHYDTACAADRLASLFRDVLDD